MKITKMLTSFRDIKIFNVKTDEFFQLINLFYIRLFYISKQYQQLSIAKTN